MKMKQTVIAAVCCILAFVSCRNGNEQIFTEAGDIGSVSIPGSYIYDAKTGTYTLTGAGSNLWFNTDACYLVWKKVSGDFSLSADVEFEGEGVNPHRKIGFMIRESLYTGARYADIAIHGDGLTSLQYRAETDSLTLENTPEKKSIGKTTIGFARKGDIISMRAGKGSLPETDDASITLELPEECYVGIFMCSHEEDVAETAHFSNVRFTGQE